MAEPVKLKRQLSLLQGVAVICGLVIGSGIYVAPKAALKGTESAGLSLILWGVGGVLATLGALTFAELGTTYPSGGEKYHYLEKTFGPFVAFMYLWMYLIMFRPGANAIKCLTFAKYILEPVFDCEVPNSAVILIAVLLASECAILHFFK
jgi:amino acid transporter